MNKTVNVNISGIAFILEVDAYQKLDRYLKSIEKLFRREEGQKEIMDDIESRIAELFKDMLQKNEEVVGLQHVNKIIEIMGEAEDYDANPEDEYETAASSSNPFHSKKLYRDDENSVLGGVCAGLGHYFGIDKIWFRLAFILTLIIYGVGIVPYLILWIIVPAAKTTAEKLEMKGEAINIDNIGNAIKDEFGNFKKKVNRKDKSGWFNKLKLFINKLINLLLNILRFAIQFIAKFIAVILGLVALLLLFSLLPILFNGPELNISIQNVNLSQGWLGSYTDVIFSSDLMYYFAMIGLILLLAIPLIALLYASIKIIFNLPSSGKIIVAPAIALWVIGIILLIFSSLYTMNEFSSEQNYVNNTKLPAIQSDTLVLNKLEKSKGLTFYDSDLLIDGDSMMIKDIKLNILKSSNDQTRLKFNQSSRGSNRKEAGEKAKNIRAIYKLKDNQLSMSPYFSAPITDKFRKQQLEIELFLPVGKSVYLAPGTATLLYDIENISNTYDGDMPGHHWKMTPSGLKCTDCAWLKSETPKDSTIQDEEDKNANSFEL